MYKDHEKIEAVTIYKQTGSVDEAMEQMRLKYGVSVSRRSVFDWAKDPRYNKVDRSGQLNLFIHTEQNNTVNIINEPKRGFELGKFVENNRELILKSTKKIDRLIGTLTKSIEPAALEQMKTADKIAALCKLEGLKIKKVDFLFRLLAETDDTEQSVARLIDGISSALNGIDESKIDDGQQVIDTQAVKEDE